MVLPSALAKKLAKRGLYASTAEATVTTPAVDPPADSATGYTSTTPAASTASSGVINSTASSSSIATSSTSATSSSVASPVVAGVTSVPKPVEKERKRDFRGVTGCPNKSNIFHDCNHWCETHWNAANLPEPNYMRNVGRLISKYPVPHHWTEVFEKGLKRYYYWDMETDIVSWLPPKHPKSIRSESATKLREKRVKGILDEDRVVYKTDEELKAERKRSSKGSRRDHRDKDSDSSDKRHKYDDKDYSRKRSRRDIIDPMDPAAYSDVPVGTWSDGLELNKSGVDSTASGALYQQRPYPAPGEILANNKSKSRKDISFAAPSYK